jgi:NTE family protein
LRATPPEARVEKLREFWEAVSTSPLGIPYLGSTEIVDEFTRRWVNQTRALGIALLGAPHYFTPRVPSPLFWPSHRADSLSHYDVTPLKSTLERLVDFDRINAGHMRFSVGAVNVRTGNFDFFDNKTHRIQPAHVMASGSLPPGFPATEVDGEYYWDGGLVSNTPLRWVLDSRPRQDTLAFQVDLWSAIGNMPRCLIDVEVRQKEIRYSSRTRAATDQYKKAQKLRLAVANLIKQLPDELRGLEDVKLLEAEVDDKVCNIVHLIYRTKDYEGVAKDYEFSRQTMENTGKPVTTMLFAR